MKKILLTVILFFLLVPCSAKCSDKTDFTYTITDNKASITGFKGEPIYIDIPDIIDGCRVTEIGDNAFYECTTLRNIILPDTIDKIGHHAFYACSSLENIIIPDTVTDIGISCFCGNSSLVYAELSENISSLPESCFRSCTSLKSIIIPDNITNIGDFCFSGCISLSTVSIGINTKKLGDCSFYMCNSLNGLYVPPSVNDMGTCSVGYVPTSNGAEKLDNFILLGNKKSTAEKYAHENSIIFDTADNSVHAIAIQRINGQRIYISSITLISFLAVIIILAILLWYKKIYHKK